MRKIKRRQQRMPLGIIKFKDNSLSHNELDEFKRQWEMMINTGYSIMKNPVIVTNHDCEFIPIPSPKRGRFLRYIKSRPILIK